MWFFVACFDVSHIMYVQFIFRSVKMAEWPPWERAALSVDRVFSLYYVYLCM